MMSYSDYAADKEKNAGRYESTPHPDSQMNYSYATSFLSRYELLRKMECEIHDRSYNHTIKQYEVSNPRYILFIWKNKEGINFTNSNSFHQNSDLFREAFDKFVDNAARRGYLKERTGNLAF